MLYRASSPLRDGLGTATGCSAEHLSTRCFPTSVASCCCASCERGLWNSGMHRSLSKNQAIGGEYLPFKTVRGIQGENQKFVEHGKTSTWQQHPLPAGELVFFFQFASSNRGLGYLLLSSGWSGRESKFIYYGTDRLIMQSLSKN